MRCPHCFNENPDDSEFCRHCGERLVAPPAVASDGIEAGRAGEVSPDVEAAPAADEASAPQPPTAGATTDPAPDVWAAASPGVSAPSPPELAERAAMDLSGDTGANPDEPPLMDSADKAPMPGEPIRDERAYPDEFVDGPLPALERPENALDRNSSLGETAALGAAASPYLAASGPGQPASGSPYAAGSGTQQPAAGGGAGPGDGDDGG
ncbi:MAG TPA: zinc ribbon domain-containing protein, partial [Caldilineaceae bacterium]|nr:zinc ribbon domain-containing protein [Caldilineaceae bacterium]